MYKDDYDDDYYYAWKIPAVSKMCVNNFGLFLAAWGAQMLPTCSHKLWLLVGKSWTPKAAQRPPKNPGNAQEV